MTKRLDQHPDLPLPAFEVVGHFRFRNGLLGRVRARKISFCEGDTIATALYAAGVRIFSRSFKYHRPRGLYDNQGHGADVLVTVDGEPNVPADCRPAEAGITVCTQNAWPSTSNDVMAVNDLIVPLLPNGFYYKMFHKPRWAWPYFEKVLRRAAGHGHIVADDSDREARYEKRYRFPDVCVVGAGPAGLAAALAAAEAGATVVLVERTAGLGGHAQTGIGATEGCPDAILDGLSEHEAARRLAERVEEHASIEVLRRTTVFAIYEDGYVAAENGRELWKIRSRSVVVAVGASERHLVFANNDIPGVMTARGVERLVGLHGIVPARRAVVVTNHDRGYLTARLLAGAGVDVVAVVDSRAPLAGQVPVSSKSAREATAVLKTEGVRLVDGRTIVRANGGRHVEGAVLAATPATESAVAASVGEANDSQGRGGNETLACDMIVVAVGYSPQLGLLSMGRGRPAWDAERDVFRMPAADLPEGLYTAGEVNGAASFGRLLQEGHDVGTAAAARAPAPESTRAVDDAIAALPADVEGAHGKHVVCRCMDVTRKEIQESIAEGFDQIETLKRYTSLGMGRCQGKLCHEAGARLVARDTGLAADDAVPTTFRPPYTPVSFGVLAGRAPHGVPRRRTPMHDCHEQAGARFLVASQWMRPEAYGEPADEVMAVRERLGMTDVSTLGKLELSGPDVLDFLHFMLPGKFARLEPGRVRYHTMVGEDGVLFEDGTIACLEAGRYFISTTTGNAEAILSNFWWWITSNGFDVSVRDLGAALAAVNVAGPAARAFLGELVDCDLSNEAFPYMSVRAAHIEGVPVHLFRIGFTGELSYEIHFPSEYGEDMWALLRERGRAHGLVPFGVEAQRVLRLEKGHLIPGTDTDALSNPYEAGVAFSIKEDKPDFIGKAFLQNFKERGKQNELIRFKLIAGEGVPEDGVVILEQGRLIGRVTSSRRSPILGYGIGLAWVESAFAEPGTEVEIRLSDGRSVWAEVLAEHAAYDPEGTRLRS